MFDFTWSEATLENAIYSMGVVILFLLLFYRKYVNRALYQSRKINHWLILSALVLIITVCTDSDWYHYRELVYNYDFTRGAYNHGEPVYGYIIQLVNRNYMLFRLIVWGGAFLLTLLTFRRFGLNVNVAVFFLIAVFLTQFNYARATLGMACYCYGLSFLLKPLKRKKWLSLLFVALLFWGAYEFHHSLLVAILFTIVAYLPMNKPYVVIALLFSLPFLASAFKNNISLIDQFDNEYLSEKFYIYLERTSSSSTFFGYIAIFISYTTFAIPIILTTIITAKRWKMLERPIIRLHRVTIGITLFALSFMFMNLDSTVFFYRILFMTIIPLSILSVYYYEKQVMSKKMYSIIVLWGILAILYKQFHVIYSLI